MSDNLAILLFGSNIDPARNIDKALKLLCRSSRIRNRSNVWVTEAVGSNGPDFLNLAVEIETSLNTSQLKKEIINPIESELKRIRTDDKYAPRTIDIDIIVFNGEVMDFNIWKRLFIALPVSEIIPDLINKSTNESLPEIVAKLKSSEHAELFKDSV